MLHLVDLIPNIQHMLSQLNIKIRCFKQQWEKVDIVIFGLGLNLD